MRSVLLLTLVVTVGCSGARGPTGPTGEAGPVGPRGPQGLQGEPPVSIIETRPGVAAVFSGAGEQITEAFSIVSGLRIFRATFPESSFFVLYLVDNASGETVELVFNESSVDRESSETRQVSKGIEAVAGVYRLQVENTDDPWVIEIE